MVAFAHIMVSKLFELPTHLPGVFTHVPEPFFVLVSSRVCSNGLCETCEGDTCDRVASQTEPEDCNLDACVCELTSDRFEEVFGFVPEEEGPVGWLEQDGEDGKSPEEPAVSIGDVVVPGDHVQFDVDNECGHW